MDHRGAAGPARETTRATSLSRPTPAQGTLASLPLAAGPARESIRNNNPPEYRADIQILRCLAVGLVLLFHLQVRGFGSGFLGVDVFFVISGFLMQALYGHGISPASFYRRRARRLLPAYFATIMATVVVAVVVTVPADFQATAHQAAWASVLAPNVGYWSEVSYFEHSVFEPLLHLWSLGVEAQFYLLVPLLLHRRSRWLAAGAVLSFLFCLLGVSISPKLSFFWMPFRLWEFAIGMLAARCPPAENPRAGLAALAGVGLCMGLPIDGKATSIFFGHPGLPCLAVTLLTAAVLVCRLPATLERSFVGIGAQRLGNASYSLYLAHFPVIVLLAYEPFGGTRLALTPWTIPLIVLSTLALYFGLERNGPHLFTAARMVAASIVVWLMAALLAPIQLARFEPRDRLIFSALSDRAEYRCGKIFRVLHPEAQFCALARGVPILLVGDSHADAIKRSFTRVAAAHGYGTYLSVANNPLRARRLSADWLKREADRLRARWVFVDYSNGNLKPEMLNEAQHALGNRLVLIQRTPEYPESVPKALLQHRRPRPVTLDPSVSAYLNSHPELAVIKVRDALCKFGCPAKDANGRPLYFDGGHLTLTGARQLEPVFERWFRAH